MEPTTRFRRAVRKRLAAIAQLMRIDTLVGFDPIRTIAEIDLSRVSSNAMRRHGWTPEQAAEAEADYRRFLYLMYRYPTQIMVPWSINLDLFWHEHILDTEKYSKDCQRLFGRFIHHDPNIRLAPRVENRARKDTAFLFSLTFRPAANGRIRSPAWLLPSARTIAIVAALSAASAQEYGNRRKKEGGACGAGGCGGGSSKSSSCGSSCSSGGSCGSGCGGGS
jgi:hypothetical protein